MFKKLIKFIILVIGNIPLAAMAIGGLGSSPATTNEVSSPWLGTPLISSNPKLGTTLGGLGAYMIKFDEDSPASMMGVFGMYSNTDSYVYGVFGNTYFNRDQQRVLAGYAEGNIKNDYSYDHEDLGNINLLTTDDIKMLFARFSQRVYGDWFVGVQYLDSTYIISGGDPFSDWVLDLLDLNGFDSTALGLVTTFDSRDNQQSASSGHNFVLHNLAYREGLGGDVSFDSYMLDYSTYIAHGNGHVLAINVKGRWTNDAPNSGFSSMGLRGYVRGQYLAEHSTHIELDERYALKDRWGLTLFGGLGCLYGDKLVGDSASCTDSENLFPSFGFGGFFVLKPKEKIVVRAEVAFGKESNRGFYLTFGQPF